MGHLEISAVVDRVNALLGAWAREKSKRDAALEGFMTSSESSENSTMAMKFEEIHHSYVYLNDSLAVLAHKENLKPSYLKSAIGAADAFKAYLDSFGGDTLKDVSEQALIISQELSEIMRTFKQVPRADAMNAWLRHADVWEKLQSYNPLAGVEAKYGENQKREIDQYLTAIWENLKNHEDHVYVASLASAYHGLTYKLSQFPLPVQHSDHDAYEAYPEPSSDIMAGEYGIVLLMAAATNAVQDFWDELQELAES